MAELSQSEFLHFLLEKLSLNDKEKEGFAVDEQGFALKMHGTSFSLKGSFDKFQSLKEAGDRDKHLGQVAAIVRASASSFGSALDFDSPFDSLKDHIFPRLREKEYVDDVNSSAKPDEILVAHKTNILPGTLSIVFIIDNKGTLSTELTHGKFKNWKITETQLFELALANLRKRTPDPLQWNKSDGGYELALEDDHIAARCLFPELFAASRPKDAINGDQVIIIPADSRLVATFSFDQLGLCFLGDTLLDYEEDADAEDTITQQALRLQLTPQARWAPFEPHEDEGRIPTDEKDVEMLFNAIQLATQRFAREQLGAGPPDAPPIDAVAAKCAACGTTVGNLAKCSRCLSVSYCSRECQKKDWPNHKANCKKQ